ncbi:hypothetical protein Droror1_Dr00010630 [Drosera rotundifolia]
MFVKKLVDKAIKKGGVGTSENCLLRQLGDINPCLRFHYGIPSGATMFAYDSIQSILAISTKYGQIKLLGKYSTQALLESDTMLASKFLQFIDNRRILLRVTTGNHIEVWDINRKLLSHVHESGLEITSFTVLQHSFFIYVGDSKGNVIVLKLDEEYHIEKMNYHIPFSMSHGSSSEGAAGTAVVHILPQPMAESKRILIIFKDGTMVLWGIQESKVISTTGGETHSVGRESKNVTMACWACPFGSKTAVGYSNGDIIIFSIFSSFKLTTDLASRDRSLTESSPPCKVNLAFKVQKIPIALMKCAMDGTTTRLYILGASDAASNNFLQVVLLNEHTESPRIKLGLQLPEQCIDMDLRPSSPEKSKHQKGFLLLLGKSGHVYAYDDHLIAKYLVQYNSRSPSSIPQEVKIKLPFPGSKFTCAESITNNSCWLRSNDEDKLSVSNAFPSLLPFEAKQANAAEFSGFANIRSLYITGQSDGIVNFWDFTSPSLIPLLSIKEQSEDYSSGRGAAITAVYFNAELRTLVSGDESGMVHIHKFKAEPFPSQISFFSLQGSSKKGNYAIQSTNSIKVVGPALCLNLSPNCKHLAVGSEQGYVSLIDIEGHELIFQKNIPSELSSAIISLQFGTCSLRGFDKKVLVVATVDSSILALDGDSGDTLSGSFVHPKKPSKGLFMQILDGQQRQGLQKNVPNELLDSGKGVSAGDIPKQPLVLLCSEKAAYLYSLAHVVQGTKKVCYKKKFGSSCCWAATFGSPSCSGLALLFACGKIEIRSLPELHLVKETIIRSFIYSSETSICCSSEGELIMVRDDQEICIISLMPQKESFRRLDAFSQVYDTNLMDFPEGIVSSNPGQKEKKNVGIFGPVIEDLRGNHTRHGEDVALSYEDLSVIFSKSNYPADVDNINDLSSADAELDIDDIELEDSEDKPKGHKHNIMGALKHQKLASRFLSFKGKSKQTISEKEKIPQAMEPPKIDNDPTVDEIKRKYGYNAASESNIAEMAKNKLNENLRKLQGINLRSTEMQDTAQSFSSMAKDLLHTFERNK